MADTVHTTLANVFGPVLMAVGAAAVVGGEFAMRFVARQLGSEGITLPTGEQIGAEVRGGAISPDDAGRLEPFAGQRLTSGPQARAYADNYVLAHMLTAARRAGVPDDLATYAGVGDLVTEKTRTLRDEIRTARPEMSGPEVALLAKAEIGDPETEFDIAREIAGLNALRSDNFFMGNAIRGMLLNAYGWWLVGMVARTAGWALAGIGGVLGVAGLRGRRRA
ncbi:hypothetical protein GCM10009785_22900 [Brooklawnia cerclae]|uniref:DUF4239 domain-containing protein n=1 Tax=Brooklawnia cerclae TaxID=349934 RepID=A0ABX0SGH2_9ACTN|nr:hypothetical protein [Brooklawnia cerclae]NIH57076.1 hypothetical protein [Brooklawnia cerclae]